MWGSEFYMRNIGSRCFSVTCPNGEFCVFTVSRGDLTAQCYLSQHCRVDTVTVSQCYQLLQIYLLLHIPTVLRETDDLTPPPPSR